MNPVVSQKQEELLHAQCRYDEKALEVQEVQFAIDEVKRSIEKKPLSPSGNILVDNLDQGTSESPIIVEMDGACLGLNNQDVPDMAVQDEGMDGDQIGAGSAQTVASTLGTVRCFAALRCPPDRAACTWLRCRLPQGMLRLGAVARNKRNAPVGNLFAETRRDRSVRRKGHFLKPQAQKRQVR